MFCAKYLGLASPPSIGPPKPRDRCRLFAVAVIHLTMMVFAGNATATLPELLRAWESRRDTFPTAKVEWREKYLVVRENMERQMESNPFADSGESALSGPNWIELESSPQKLILRADDMFCTVSYPTTYRNKLLVANTSFNLLSGEARKLDQTFNQGHHIPSADRPFVEAMAGYAILEMTLRPEWSHISSVIRERRYVYAEGHNHTWAGRPAVTFRLTLNGPGVPSAARASELRSEYYFDREHMGYLLGSLTQSRNRSWTLEIFYRQEENGQWVIDSAIRQNLDGHGKLVEQIEFLEFDYDFDYVGSTAEMAITFPPGTLVLEKASDSEPAANVPNTSQWTRYVATGADSLERLDSANKHLLKGYQGDPPTHRNSLVIASLVGVIGLAIAACWAVWRTRLVGNG